MNDGNKASAKQQIVDKVRDSSNILVTVNKDPTVDELSAALGLTLLLNKLNKHATCVFSGKVPPAISFLDPEKTFEGTVDSLRDFIIALDKEKADHLRYKVDGDVVKIFITPYRTTISDKDLEFSQGDYNVEMVLALGVRDQDSLDQALAAHGRIFHDAVVATVSAGDESSTLGSIDWRESNASSFSEMVVNLADGLKAGQDLLDDQTSTALLTGIVAATDRFSNSLTTSRVMTVAAELMAAGANQQLIAAKLEEAHEITEKTSGDETAASDGKQNSDGSTDLSEGQSSKVKKDGKTDKKTAKESPKKKKDGDGELSISHEKKGDLDEVARQTEAEQQAEAAKRAEEELRDQTATAELNKSADQKLADELAKVTTEESGTSPSVADLQKDIAAAASDVDEAASQPAPAAATLPPIAPASQSEARNEPSLGGTLNATTEEAAEQKRREEKADRNRTILSHAGTDYVSDATSQPMYSSPLNSTMDPKQQDAHKPLPDPMASTTAPTASAPTVQPPAGATLAQIDSENRATPHQEARSAIDAAFAAQGESAPAASPVMPPLPDFSTLPPLPPQLGTAPTPAAGEPNPFLTPPAAGSSPSVQPSTTAPTPAPNPFVSPSAAATPPTLPSDPNQFQIPGQK